MTQQRVYRALLRCYPWEHRQRYEDEMLGVLLDSAGPRRHPGVRDVLDLLRGAVLARSRYTAARLRGPSWRHAGAVLGLLGTLGMTAYAVRPILFQIAMNAVVPWAAAVEFVAWHSRPRAIAWTVALLLVLLTGVVPRLRMVAGLAAALATSLELGRIVDEYGADLSVFNSWPLALGVLSTAALTIHAFRSGPGEPLSAVAVLGRWRCTALVAAAGAGALSPTLEWLGHWNGWWSGVATVHTTTVFTYSVTPLEAVVLSGALVLVALAVLTAAAPVRRRLLALLAPVGVTLLVTRWTVTAWTPGDQTSGYWTGSLTATQWLAVVLAPVLSLVLGVALVHRRERGRPPAPLAADPDGPRSAGVE